MDDYELDEGEPADLDGDGEFDAIDIMFLEEGEKEGEGRHTGSTGCCVPLIIMVTFAGRCVWF